MEKALLVLALFSSCNKTIYSTKYDDGHIEYLALLKKSGDYQYAFANFKKDQYNWSGFVISKANCDSFRLDRWRRTDGSKKNDIRFYRISKKGMIPADFSNAEIKLISELKRLSDSLGWCHRDILCCPDSLFMQEIPKKKKPYR